MEINKVYRPISSMREKFIKENSHNLDMLSLIDNNGGEFTVLELDDGFVTKVSMKNGSKFDGASSSEHYFEISSDEFYAFEKVVEEPKSGIISMVIEVTHETST